MTLGIADSPGRLSSVLLNLSVSAMWLSSLAYTRPSRTWRLWALGVAILVNAGVMLAAWAIRATRRRASVAWPSDSGKVLSAKIRKTPCGEYPFQGRYLLNVLYSYYARGERYSGFEERRFRDQSEADAAAARLRDATVTVKYNPRDPEVSVLT